MKKKLLLFCTLLTAVCVTASQASVSVGGAPLNGADPALPLESISALPAQMSPSNPGKLIAYDRCYRDLDTWDIFCDVSLVSVDGLGQPYGISDAISPSWSPDGSRIAFIRYSLGGLFVYNLNDGSITSVDSGGGSPVWSPDGSRIAFIRSSQGRLFVYNLNDGSITSVDSGGQSPAWSPDGTKLAFSSGELFVMSADGSLVQLTNNVGFRGQPAWSSDGATIAFDCEVESGNYDICSINADGTGFIRLTSGPGRDSGATFLPDGSGIAFFTLGGIAIMNPDGTVIITGISGSEIAWSSDSRRIAFVQEVSDCEADGRICPASVYVVNRDGSGRQWIAYGNSPTWAGSSGNPMAWPGRPECNGLDCTFYGNLSWGGIGALSYSWDFGDGTSGSGQTITHTYATAGTYRVTLTVTDETGATSSRSQDTNVDGNVWPTARFTYACTGWQCTFDASGSSDPDGTIERYRWYFGDGGADYGQVATHTYNAAGSFTVTLYVTDNRGRIDTEQQVVNLVANSPPVASLTAVCTGLTCAFDASASSDADGVIENYAWNFGDGTAAAGVTASHTYLRAGTFAVSLTVTDNIGGTGVQERPVTVSPTMHIGDLDGTRTNNQNAWTALVTITVHDDNHNPVSSAAVSGSWSIGGAGSCTTDGSGRCQISRSTIPKKTQSVMFTITNVTQNMRTYDAVSNHDPDGDSNGTSITVRGP